MIITWTTTLKKFWYMNSQFDCKQSTRKFANTLENGKESCLPSIWNLSNLEATLEDKNLLLVAARGDNFHVRHMCYPLKVYTFLLRYLFSLQAHQKVAEHRHWCLLILMLQIKYYWDRHTWANNVDLDQTPRIAGLIRVCNVCHLSNSFETHQPLV